MPYKFSLHTSFVIYLFVSSLLTATETYTVEVPYVEHDSLPGNSSNLHQAPLPTPHFNDYGGGLTHIPPSMNSAQNTAEKSGVRISNEARFKNFKCEWVESAAEPAKPVENVWSTKLPTSCNKVESNGRYQNSKNYNLICSGTTKCHAVLEVGEHEKAAELFFENTMCLANGDKCLNATDCVQQGGVFSENAAEMIFNGIQPDASGKPKTFNPKKREIAPKQPEHQENHENHSAPASI